MQRVVIATGLIFLIMISLSGCGGGSSAPKVATITVTPTTLSLNAGDVVQISASATDAKNNSVSTTFTFASSNTSVAGVSTTGLVCGGVWDASFIVCNGLGPGNTPISGTANITAAAEGITSTAVTVTVHPKITNVKVDPILGCISTGTSFQLVPHAFSNGTEVPTTATQFTWNSLDGSIVTIDTGGVATAKTPGATGVSATLSGVSSTATGFRTCLPTALMLHAPGTNPVTAVTLNPGQSQAVEVDMVDENGKFTSSAPIPVISNNTVTATVSGTSATAVSPGGAGLMAACSPPSCGSGINTPVYSNVFSVTVAGLSPGPQVYATSSFTPPSGTSSTLVPIDGSGRTAGTAINLPGPTNSMVFSSSGNRAYLGGVNGLATLDPSNNSITVVANIIGVVLAVSPDGSKAIVSNAANDPGTRMPIEPDPTFQRLWVWDNTAKNLQTFHLAGGLSAAFNADGFKAYVAAGGNFYVLTSPFTHSGTVALSGNAVSVAPLASEDFAYFAGLGGLQQAATCNDQVRTPAPLSTAQQFVQSVLNQDVIVSLDSNNLNIETVTVTPPSAPPACPPTVSNSNLPVALAPLGLGPITANQLLVASNGSHVLVLPHGQNAVFTSDLSGALVTIPLPANATEALTGGIVPDGSVAWVAVAGANAVDLIDLNGHTVGVQIPMPFTKIDGSPAPPNVVAVRPK